MQWSGNLHQYETKEEVIQINTKSIKLNAITSDEALLRLGSHLIHDALTLLWIVALYVVNHSVAVRTLFAHFMPKKEFRENSRHRQGWELRTGPS